MKKTSNINMEQVFDHLASIKKIEPSKDLYFRTKNAIKNQKIIPLFWVIAAACFLIAIVGVEFYIFSNKKNTFNQEISIIFPKTNNILYHE